MLIFNRFYIEKVWLHQKLVEFDRKWQFISKTTAKMTIFDQIRPIFYLNGPNFNLIRLFSIAMVRISNQIVGTIDRTAEIQSKSWLKDDSNSI